MDWIDIQKDDAHMRREREKARILRASQWWHQQIQPGVCAYCKKQVGAENLTMDHVVPVARGGCSTKSNVVPACKTCNNKKTYRTPAEDILAQLEAEEPSTEHYPEHDSTSVPERPILIIADPHGFCSGVARAIAIAEKTLAQNPGTTIYCLHEIVHNEHVVAHLEAAGMRFVSHLEEIPPGATVLFSAHGVTPAIRKQARARQLTLIDATCPFVEKVHAEVRRFAAEACFIVCIGHRDHQEVIGIAGEAPEHVHVVEKPEDVDLLDASPSQRVAVVSQTTLSTTHVDRVMARLHSRFPSLEQPSKTDICYATRDRQQAVSTLAKNCEWVIVLGSANSSNSRRLVETAEAAGARATLVSTMEELRQLDVRDAHCIGITSGASTPESFMDAAIAYLRG